MVVVALGVATARPAGAQGVRQVTERAQSAASHARRATPKPNDAGSIVSVDAVDRIAASHLADARGAGLSLAIIQDGKLVIAKAYGSASLSPAVAVDTATRFAVGSITKEFVAAAALMLQQDGRLSLTDPVSKYYPELTRSGDITLLDLMHHVAGYRDYYPLDFMTREMAKPTTADQIIEQFGKMPLDFEPRTRWSYSNTGYIILGRVLEKASGQPLSELLDRRLFTPLGMHHTALEPGPVAGAAVGYTWWATDDAEVAQPEGAGWLGAAAGVWSTPADLAKWDIAIMSGTPLLSVRSRAVMLTAGRLRDGSSTEYAGGLVITETGGRLLAEHRGGTAGFASSNVMVLNKRAAVIMLTNFDGTRDPMGFVDLVVPPSIGASITRASATPPVAPQRPPSVKGPPAPDVARLLFCALQAGLIDRRILGPEFAFFLNPDRVRQAAASLSRLGAPSSVTMREQYERGGMELTVLDFHFGDDSWSAVLDRTPDGLIQEFMLLPLR
jgi:CubicO group peptidase (beta-lactamase class C family)